MCCAWSGALKMLPRGSKIIQIPRDYHKNVYCVESLRFCRYGGDFIFEGVALGGTPPFKKVLILVQRPQHKSTSDSVRAPQQNRFGAILIEFGDTKK